VVVATNQAGYTGTGFVDYGVNGSWLEWNNISSTNGGSATLTFTYANASSTPANRPCEITVNGVSAGTVTFVPTASWTTWTPVSINVTLKAGNNTIRVTANTSTGGPNLDKMDVTQLKSAPTGVNIQQSDALIISPNPVEGGSAIVTIDLTAASQLNIVVINYLGKVVYQKNFGVCPAGKTNQVIDLTSLPKGSYIIRAQTANGNKTTKLIKL
jgi:hypothetical protein